MRISFMKTAALAAATTVASAGVLVGTTAAAHATGGVDITAVSGSAVIGTSAQWVNIRMAATVDPSVTSWYANQVDVYRGSVKVGTTTNIYQTSNNQLTVKLSNSWGRGTFTLRNLQGSYYTSDNSGSIVDNSIAGGIAVKGASDGNLAYHNALNVTARGKKHSFTVGLRYFSTTGWKPWAAHKVSIQQKVGAKWKTIKVLKLNSKGKSAWVRKTGKKYSYRLLTAGTSTVIGGATRGTSKL